MSRVGAGICGVGMRSFQKSLRPHVASCSNSSLLRPQIAAFSRAPLVFHTSRAFHASRSLHESDNLSPISLKSTPSPSIPTQFSSKAPLFNTYSLIEHMRDSGMTEVQAKGIMLSLMAATEQAQAINQSTLATKAEFAALGSELNEKIFNSSLKNDLQQKHLREIFKSDLEAIKNDMHASQRTSKSEFQAFQSETRMNQKVEIAALQQQILRLEKQLENQQMRLEKENQAIKDQVNTVQEQIEHKILKYTVTFFVSVVGLVLTIIRIFGLSGK